MTFHSIERIGPPFRSVSEVGVVIPRGGLAEIANAEFKLLFFLEADCKMTIPGAGVFTVKKGDICVMPFSCVQQYSFERVKQSSRVHALKISFSLPPLPAPGQRTVRHRKAADPEGDLTEFVRHHFREFHFLPGAQTPAMQEIMRGIRVEAEQRPPGIRHRARALCTNLVVHVARRLHDTPSTAPASGTGYGFIVTQVKEFLTRNMTAELTLAQIAWNVKKSEEHLARVFRKVTGQTVFDYLRTMRLERAKTMLVNSDMTLTEIAERTGFSSLSLFSRNFNQYVGQSASAYRHERSSLVRW